MQAGALRTLFATPSDSSGVILQHLLSVVCADVLPDLNWLELLELSAANCNVHALRVLASSTVTVRLRHLDVHALLFKACSSCKLVGMEQLHECWLLWRSLCGNSGTASDDALEDGKSQFLYDMITPNKVI